MSTALFLFITIFATNSGDSVPAPSQHYHLVKRIFTDSGGIGLLSIDSQHRILYGAGNSVVNIDRDTTVAHLAPSIGHGYAIASDLDRVITRRAAIVDDRTFAILDPGLGSMDATVVYDAATHRAFVVSDTALVLDVAKQVIVARVALGAVAISATGDNEGHLYIGTTTDSLISLNASTMTVDRRIFVPGCASPGALAFSSATRRLFASCHNGRLVVIDVDDGRIVATLLIDGFARELAFDPTSRLLFNPTGTGTMDVFHQDEPDKYTALPPVQTAEGGSEAAVDQTTGRVYLVKHLTNDAVRILVFAP